MSITMTKVFGPWADLEWAEHFIQEEKKLNELEKGDDEYAFLELLECLADQWIEMGSDTQQLVIKLREHDNG